ncbi:hypothetical protein Rsub_04551 [Raphidocelis subcapitata]|uniref:Uncharacterized protein n=1 Tax=Raphidocelis subcapitata TaxID=307507 RepID=A0A2V0P5J4_9CHLO|nr:hypothetical protein Rsub_04551 [Raphidocelis subcapitata]|eukprot:GBF92447.1 hypothetical protein Rsub_04551 [Raphidocelis subcapitata]
MQAGARAPCATPGGCRCGAQQLGVPRSGRTTQRKAQVACQVATTAFLGAGGSSYQRSLVRPLPPPPQPQPQAQQPAPPPPPPAGARDDGGPVKRALSLQEFEEQRTPRWQRRRAPSDAESQQQRAGGAATSSSGDASSSGAEAEPCPVPDARPFTDALTECGSWQAVSQLWTAQQQQQAAALASAQARGCDGGAAAAAPAADLSPEALVAAVERLASVTSPRSLGARARSQLNSLLGSLTAGAHAGLSAMPHALVPRTLVALSSLQFVPDPAWVRSVAQHAATSLASYGPGDLALLITYAARATALAAALAAPPGAVSAAAAPQPAGWQRRRQAPAAPPARPQPQQQQQQQGRPVVVVTKAWLDHFMAAFERFLAAPPAKGAPRGAGGGGSASASRDSFDGGDGSETQHQSHQSHQQHQAQHHHSQQAQHHHQQPQQQQLQPQHMDAVLSALVALRASPDPSWLYVFCRQLGGQIAARAVPPATLLSIASSLGALGYRMPDHIAGQFERQVAAALPTLAPRELQAALRALPALRHRPSEAWTRALFARLLPASAHLPASAVVAAVAAASAMGHDLGHGALDALLLQARHALSGLAPQEHVSLIDALSAQHYRPGPGFMEEFMESLGARLPSLTLPQLAALLAGLAAVAYKPRPEWMRACMLAVVGAPPAPGDAPELLRLLGALRRMQYTPTGDILSGLEAQIEALGPGLDFRATQQLRAALSALEYVPQTTAAAAAAAAAAAPAGADGAAGDAAAGDGAGDGAGEARAVLVSPVVDALLADRGGAAAVEAAVRAAAGDARLAAAEAGPGAGRELLAAVDAPAGMAA